MPFKEEANVRRPQVAYRETITRPAQAQGKYVKQTSGPGLYGDVWLKVEPNARGKGFSFLNEIEDSRVPKEYIASVEAGIQKTLSDGLVAGFPMVDIVVRLYDGSSHEGDSSAVAFEGAGALALRAAVQKAAPMLLEPVMLVIVQTPLEWYKEVIGDLNRRRGTILGMESRGAWAMVRVEVPQAELVSYGNDLRSTTSGQASFTEEFAHYDLVPLNVAQEVIAKVLQ